MFKIKVKRFVIKNLFKSLIMNRCILVTSKRAKTLNVFASKIITRFLEFERALKNIGSDNIINNEVVKVKKNKKT